MDRAIRIVGVVLLACFGLLFLQLNKLQLLQAHTLATAPGNPRPLLQQVDAPRGDIQTADGVVVAESQPTSGQVTEQRVYPHGPLYADVTGYDSVVYGLFGAEETYNAQLTSHAAPIGHLSDLLTNRTTTDTVTLTIESKVQTVAAGALGDRDGAVVALDPRTGAVLAMYSAPTFDPNLLASHDIATEESSWKSFLANPSQPLLSRAYRQRFPPGSTFKIVTAATVYDHDPSLLSQTFPQLSMLALPNSNSPLHNFGNEVCGGQLLTLFAVSCDTGFGQIGLDLGGTSLAVEAGAFGFGKVPTIDLPAAASSAFPAASSFAENKPGLAYSAIGQQNVAATPLQMALVGAAVADQGKVMTPHIMSQIRDSQGNVVQTYQPTVWTRATSASTAASLKTLMLAVTAPGGTGTNVAIPGVAVAAKTGTAQTGNSTSSSNDDWLVAFAPAQAPSVAVAVVVNDQPPSATGAEVAGPIARDVLSAALGSAAS